MVKEHKLLVAVKSQNLNNVLKVLDKYNKQKSRISSNKSKKIDFDLFDNLGLTVMHHAARNGSVDILEALLVHGGAFDIFDNHGLRPIGYACAEGHLKVVEYLLRWGSCPNRISTVEYLTPLHLSAMYGYVEIAHLLLKYNADPFVVNRDNKTPLDLACAYGKYNVINLLFSFTTSLANNTEMQAKNNAMEYYGARTPQSDHMSRCKSLNQSNVPGTPKVDRYLTKRSSSPYGSANSSSGDNSNYNTNSSKSKVVRNIKYVDNSYKHTCLSHNNVEQSVKSTLNYSKLHELTETALLSCASTVCVPPSLDVATTTDMASDLRQNLREACFAVQAKALINFGRGEDCSKTISFEIGDLITVLKQYHNGVMKGFVTSQGIGSTGLFPSIYVEIINDHTPPSCCDKPVENIFQSPEKTPIPNRGKSSKERPHYLNLQDTAYNKDCESDAENDVESGSPIIIPPQMTNIRTNVTTSAPKWSTSGLPRCTCDHHPENESVKRPSQDLPSVSINDLSYALSMGQGLISAASVSTYKRNSIVSMDSGRGSATDSKSVVSGCTQASINCNKPPTSPSHGSQIKNNADFDTCDCGACTILPPTVPAPYHQHENHSCKYRLNSFLVAVTPERDFVQARTESYSKQVSIDSLYYPCSMISLDGTQYSSGSSDRGNDDVMINWLHSVGLGSYAETLSISGYDLATLTKATPEDLNASGITNPKDRQYMKTQLNRLSIYDGLPEIMPSTIHEFLEGLKLIQYEELFMRQKFSKMDDLLGLTWEDLADIGIQKLGHQKKLSLAMERLSRLVHFNNHSSNDHTISPPSSRVYQDSPNKSGHVSQSRSFEELPYPSVIMSDQDSQDIVPRSQYKDVRLVSYKGNVVGKTSGLLSKSDESVSSVTEMSLQEFSPTSYSRKDDLSMSSSTSSCSQESGQDLFRPSQNIFPSSASHFGHDNMGTVRIKRSLLPHAQENSTEHI